MVYDITGNKIKEGDLIAYSVQPGNLRVGVVTGISERSENFPNEEYNSIFTKNFDFVQITPIKENKIINKWFLNNNKKFMVVGLENQNLETLKNYYRLSSQISDWKSNGKGTHPREIEK